MQGQGAGGGRVPAQSGYGVLGVGVGRVPGQQRAGGQQAQQRVGAPQRPTRQRGAGDPEPPVQPLSIPFALGLKGVEFALYPSLSSGGASLSSPSHARLLRIRA